MPRNGSGIFTPSGANFPAVSQTIIESTKYNNVINEISTALTDSIAKDGQTVITGNINFSNNKAVSLAAGTAAGDSVRFNHLQKGSDIAVSSNGVKTIPNEGSYFVLTGTGFNITGFNANYSGRIVTLELPTGLTLVNGASLLLKGGFNRQTFVGDTITLVNTTGSTWREINYHYALGIPAFRAHRNGTNSGNVAITTITQVLMTTSDYDPYSSYDFSNYTVPCDGRYRFILSIASSSTNQNEAETRIRVNGLDKVIDRRASDTNTSSSSKVDYEAILFAGDIVTPYFQWLSGISANVSGNIAFTYFYGSKCDE